MKKRGFTLIELLAVIVILAIIALIATPAVLNIIEDSRKGAAEASARNIVSAAKTYYMSETMNGRTVGTIDLSTDALKYDGDQAEKGYIKFTNGKPESEMYISGYCVSIAIDGSVTSEKIDLDECLKEKDTGDIEEDIHDPEPIVYKKYTDGTPLLFNPNDNIKCDILTGSATGLKDGCMKWYAFLDSESSSTVKLILDHNTTGYILWANSSEKTPTLVMEQLIKDISNWDSTIKNSARIISAEEINEIAPTQLDYSWNKDDYNTKYYLHTGKSTEYKGTKGSNAYAWLFDNTNGCEDYGCYNNSISTNGYWTSTYAGASRAWQVSCNGSLNYNDIIVHSYRGVRPVIEVSKDVFE